MLQTFSTHLFLKACVAMRCIQRDYGEGWPLLTVDTEANMGTQGVHMKGDLPWLVRWAPRAGNWDLFSYLGFSSRPSTQHFCSPLSLSLSKLGRQSCRVACLLICVSGCNWRDGKGWLEHRPGPIIVIWGMTVVENKCFAHTYRVDRQEKLTAGLAPAKAGWPGTAITAFKVQCTVHFPPHSSAKLGKTTTTISADCLAF